ncbi:uncharacterized protein Z518_00159 [Rhinocladiella mackenziei CBS 650.93]|uniref:Uncharacterized protein n=1 Tax=Rhinocladiella mackenziei CBS 650.93 TaxID=1442369 RepID=A0A0D2J0C4_9EURO|nr:uncharacterized protein Z518_00159 [Rhinocladiella mackenziei CBS 650.93]KIX09081.1 hypothetical protein Z518_00159 [Rhinocladiella mackenziei CBS 650.93]
MPLTLPRIQSSMLGTRVSHARSISRIYSQPRFVIPPLVSQPCRHFSRERFAGAVSPSIKEKLPDPDLNPFRFSEFDLQGKVFVVTGGGRGLGLTLAEALVEASGEVYCLDKLLEPEKEFRLVQRRLGPQYGGALHYHQVDVREADNVDRVISDIAAHHQRMDGLIAAAGVQYVTPALEYPPDKIMEMLDVNYKGVYCSAVSCARQMIEYNCSGSILLIASMSGLVANKGFTSSVYNSSKAAVCQLARSLAMEWGKAVKGKPIRVNALCPGNIITPMVLKNFADDPKLKELWERENMLGRLSQPAEYRGAALFCLSDASTFMTGSQLIIDGGYTAW